MIRVVYFSNRSENTHRFAQKLPGEHVRIPLIWDETQPLIVDEPYILFVPTYGAGNDVSTIPKPVRNFLNVPENRDKLEGIVGFGNTNFGEHFCKAAQLISAKTGKPVVAKVEIFGTEEDLEKVKHIMEEYPWNSK